MKHLFFTPLIAVCLFSTSYASTAGLFSFDEEAIEAAFAQIDQFESFVAINHGITFSEIQNNGSLHQFDLNWESYDVSTSPMFGIEDMDWNTFVCGLCCWPIGVFTVLLDDGKDNDSKVSYVIGAIVGSVLGTTGVWGFYSTR